MTGILRRSLLAALLVVGGCAAGQAADAPTLEPLTVHTGQGEVRLQVEIADDDEERARGLMYRDSLAPDRGMLFIFDPPRQVGFWMRNTRIPLDMIFIDRHGRVVNIAAMTTPYSLESVPSDGPVLGVLEIAGGRAAQLRIAPGDTVSHRAFAR